MVKMSGCISSIQFWINLNEFAARICFFKIIQNLEWRPDVLKKDHLTFHLAQLVLVHKKGCISLRKVKCVRVFKMYYSFSKVLSSSCCGAKEKSTKQCHCANG